MPKRTSACGIGRPGWHIECSAMSCATLGETFDIHGGGADLQFPHHENEIAQSEGASGKPLARFWVHNGFVRVDNEKMSKSLGNFFTIREVLQKYDAESRALLPGAHALPQRVELQRCASGRCAQLAQAALHGTGWRAARIGRVGDRSNAADAARFKAAMDEDFGTPEAIAVLFDLAGEVNRTRSPELAGLLKALGGTLGVLQGDPQAFLQAGSALDDAAIQLLIAERATAKAAKNFPRGSGPQSASNSWSRASCWRISPTGTTWASAQ